MEASHLASFGGEANRDLLEKYSEDFILFVLLLFRANVEINISKQIIDNKLIRYNYDW